MKPRPRFGAHLDAFRAGRVVGAGARAVAVPGVIRTANVPVAALSAVRTAASWEFASSGKPPTAVVVLASAAALAVLLQPLLVRSGVNTPC